MSSSPKSSRAILKLIPETEALYETSIIDADDAENLLAEARELLAVRNLHALQEVSNLQATTSVLLTRTEEAEDSSRRDALTGALNRAWLDRLLDREFTQAVVFGRDLSIAHVDIDRFKSVNEKFGTQAGDRVLTSCVQKLQSCVRGSDLVARFSGEEFMVVLPGADRDIARQVAQRILEAVADANHDPESGSVNITASIGLATYTTRQRFPSTLALLEAADHALYAAKLCGRNRFECFEDLSASGRNSAAGSQLAIGSADGRFQPARSTSSTCSDSNASPRKRLPTRANRCGLSVASKLSAAAGLLRSRPDAALPDRPPAPPPWFPPNPRS